MDFHYYSTHRTTILRSLGFWSWGSKSTFFGKNPSDLPRDELSRGVLTKIIFLRSSWNVGHDHNLWFSHTTYSFWAMRSWNHSQNGHFWRKTLKNPTLRVFGIHSSRTLLNRYTHIWHHFTSLWFRVKIYFFSSQKMSIFKKHHFSEIHFSWIRGVTYWHLCEFIHTY